MTATLTSAATRSATRSRGDGLAAATRGADQRRWSWVALGVLVMLATGLLFYLWVQRLDERVAVLVAHRAIQPGEVVVETDVRVTEVGQGELGRFVLATEARDLVIGHPAAAVIPEGSFLHPGHFGATDPLAAGDTVVGAVLVAGEYPTARLLPGELVVMIETKDGSPVAGASASGRQIGVARVHATSYLAGPASPGDAVFVSLVVRERAAIEVADAAASDRLRLVLVPGDVDVDGYLLGAGPEREVGS